MLIMCHVRPMSFKITWLVVCIKVVIFVRTVTTHDRAVCGARLVFNITVMMLFALLITLVHRLAMIVVSDRQRHCLRRAKTTKRMRPIAKARTRLISLMKRPLTRSHRDFIVVIVVMMVMVMIILMMVTKVKKIIHANRKLRIETRMTRMHNVLKRQYNKHCNVTQMMMMMIEIITV